MSASGLVYPGQPLTSRELDVLRLLARGRNTAGIARELGLSPNTIKTHVARLLTKLGADTRAHAVALAYHRRILLVPSASELEQRRQWDAAIRAAQSELATDARTAA